MSQKTVILLILGAFVLVPILCMGGLLEHACDCGEETKCNHEIGCGDDPCSAKVLRGDDQSFKVSVFLSKTLNLVSLWAPEVLRSCRGLTAEPRPPDLINIPYPPSSLPLLR